MTPKKNAKRNKLTTRRAATDLTSRANGVKGGLMASLMTNLANMRHEMLKSFASNLRA